MKNITKLTKKMEYLSIISLTGTLAFLYSFWVNHLFPQNAEWSILTSVAVEVVTICSIFGVIYAMYRQKRFLFLQKAAIYFSFSLIILVNGLLIASFVFALGYIIPILFSLFLMVGFGYYLLEKGMKKQ